MPSFELSKLQPVTGLRALGDTDRTSVQAGSGAKAGQRVLGGASNGVDAGISLEVGATLNTSAPPINNDRVGEIRNALREGTYPLIPAQISDALIAAQMSFEIER